MNIGSLCKRAVVAIDAGSTLRAAAAAMQSQHVGALLVTAESDGHRDAVGLVTDRDLAMACVARNLTPDEVFIGAVASRPLVSIPASADAAQAAELLRTAGVRRLVVVDGEGQVCGLLSSDDLLDALIAPLQSLAAAFRADIAREEAMRATLMSASPRPVFLPMGTPGMRA